MSKFEKLLATLLAGNADQNFSLNDLVNILENLGFTERQSKSGTSHRIFTHPALIGKIINLQAGKQTKSQAKSYQVKQVREIIVELQKKSEDGDNK